MDSDVARIVARLEEQVATISDALCTAAQDSVPELPRDDAPYLKVMDILNDVLGNCKDLRPPARNLEGFLITACKQVIPNTHVYGVAPDDKSPAPPQWAFMQLDEAQTAELIERHIDFVRDGVSVHLQKDFVKHFMKRPNDPALPSIVSIATAPLVLADGTILAPEGLEYCRRRRSRRDCLRIRARLQRNLQCVVDLRDRDIVDTQKRGRVVEGKVKIARRAGPRRNLERIFGVGLARDV